MHVAPYLERVYIGGARYRAQIASAYFYTETERKRAVAAAPAVVLLDKPLAEAEQALALLTALVSADHKQVVIVGPELTGAALNLLVANHVQPADKRKIAVMGIKLSAGGDELRSALQDLALMTGATVLGDGNARPVSSVRAADIGRANRVEFAEGHVIVTAESDRRSMVQNEIASARRRLAALPYDDSERPALVRRLAALSGGVGVLKIGDYYSTSRELRRTQAERAWKVLSAVQRGGVVPGGGAALLHCRPAVLAAADRTADEEVALGMRVLAQALPALQRQILVNASVAAPAVFLDQLQTAGAPAAFDAIAATVVDAHAQGLLDATDIVLSILNTAVSGATMALSTDTIVYHRKPKQSTTP
jgi:chaperonin GroEL